MKLHSQENKLETNSEMESQDFTIGDASVVIEILRNRLYENKIQSICQEIISNARDAMREVGKDNSLEITVPNRLNPVFKVRDFGPSISPDRMANVFIRYGSSTKRQTNEQTGGLGIGAKSPFSYTDSFTVTTFLGGLRRSYIAHIGVNNQGRLDLISTEQTDEVNGTEIQMAVKPHDIDEFRKGVFRTIYFWENKPTLKGELSPPVLVSGQKVGDTEIIDNNMLPEYVRPSSYHSEMLAIIDGIPYPITQKLISKVPSLQKLNSLVIKQIILHFGNGVVEVSASRESIADSRYTLEALAKIASRAYLEVSTHISDAFGKVKNTTEYLNTYARMSRYFKTDEFAKFGDYTIDSNWIKNPLFKKVNIISVSCLNRVGRRCEKIDKNLLSESRKQIPIEHLSNLFYSTVTESIPKQNKRIREYLKGPAQMFIVEPMWNYEYETVKNAEGRDEQKVKSKSLDQASFNQVVLELGIKDFQSITYVDVPKVKAAGQPYGETMFCYHKPGQSSHWTSLKQNTQKWLYVQGDKSSRWGTYDSKELASLSYYLADKEDLKICAIGKRTAAMIQGDPNYTPLSEWLEDYKPSKTEILSAKNKVSTNEGLVEGLAKLKDVKDKFLTEMVNEYKTFEKHRGAILPRMLTNKISDLEEIKEFKQNDEKLEKYVRVNYSLLTEFSPRYFSKWTEISIYVNAKYKEIKNA